MIPSPLPVQAVPFPAGTVPELSPDGFRVLFDLHPDAQLLWDPYEDRILKASEAACRLLKRSRAELLGTPPSALHSGERGALVVFTDAVLERGEFWTDGLSCELPDGSRLALEYCARRIDLEGRQLVLWRTVATSLEGWRRLGSSNRTGAVPPCPWLLVRRKSTAYQRRLARGENCPADYRDQNATHSSHRLAIPGILSHVRVGVDTLTS